MNLKEFHDFFEMFTVIIKNSKFSPKTQRFEDN